MIQKLTELKNASVARRRAATYTSDRLCALGADGRRRLECV